MCTYAWTYVYKKVSAAGQSEHPELQDTLICTSEGEEDHRCQTRKAAKLDADGGFHPWKHCWSISKRLLPELQVCQYEERECHWDFYSAGSLHAFQPQPPCNKLKGDQLCKNHWRGPSVNILHSWLWLLPCNPWILSYVNWELTSNKRQWGGNGGWQNFI